MTILYWRNKTCLCCPLIYNKKKKVIQPSSPLPGCFHSAPRAFILLSSFNIPTVKSRSVLFVPFISTGGSWTLKKFSSLFLSGVGSVEESESLLLMPPGSHSLLSQYHTGQNNSQWKIKFVLVEDAYLQSQHIVKISRDSDKIKEDATEWNSVFSESPSERRQGIEQRIAVVWLTLISPGAHNPERLTSILRLCNGVFTSRSIFR